MMTITVALDHRPGLVSAARGLLAAMPGNVAVVDVHGTVVLTNPAWDAFARAGGGAGDPTCAAGADYLAVCRAAADAGVAAGGLALEAFTFAVATGGASTPFTYACETPGGTRWFLATTAWWGDLPGVVVSHVDVTESVAARHASEASLRALSHDLRTPLTVVIGLGRVLATRRHRLDEEQLEAIIGRLLAGAHRLESDLENLTARERLEAGNWRARPADTDIGRLVCDLVRDLDLAAGRVTVTVPDDLTCRVDGPWIERIVANLVVNADRHVPRERHVWVRADRAGDALELLVEDDGHGIPAEDRERLLRAFEQGGSTPGAGSGLGLHLVARFTELLGGELVVDERPGGGARFRVTLPLAEQGIEPCPPPSAASPTSAWSSSAVTSRPSPTSTPS